MIRRTLPITPAIIGTKLLGVLRLISGEGLGVISCGEGLGGVIPCGEGLGGVLICGERLGAIITDGDGAGGSVRPEENCHVTCHGLVCSFVSCDGHVSMSKNRCMNCVSYNFFQRVVQGHSQ